MLGMSGERPRVSIEVTLSNNLRVIVSGSPDKEELAEAVKNALEAISKVSKEMQIPLRLSIASRGVSEEVIRRVDEMSNKEIILTLLHFEGPMSKRVINQRSRELGKEIKESWLDKNLYKEMEGLLTSEDSPEGVKLYKLTERGRIEAERLLERLGLS